MNRLVNSSYDGRKESFTYDKVGNRLTKTTNGITETYVYNVKNQLKELHNKEGITFFTFDKQGNTLKEETTQGTNSFEYNTLNQQVKAITKEGNTLVNRYDAEGLRYEIEENDKLTKFIFHNDEVLVETNENDNVVSRIIRGYDVVAADVKDNRYYYSVDEQGSTEFITDRTGKVRNEYRYDAFGNILEAKEDIHNRITYTGQQFDKITQQYYLRARFYNPVIGRFTQEDEYRGDGLNLYVYCGNNPVIYYDPSGYLCSKKINQLNKEIREFKGNRGEYLRKKYGELKPEEINERINIRSNIVFSYRKNNSPIKQGGYKVNDIDKYKKNSPGQNRAEGHKHSPEDGRVESHHPIQNEWAIRWAKRYHKKYSKRNAPGILLKSSSGEAHAQLSALQRERRMREGFNTSIRHEFNTSYKEILGVEDEYGNKLISTKDARKAIKEAYRYFDSIGGFD